MKRKNVIFIGVLIIVIIIGIIISYKSKESTQKISKENKVEHNNIESENKEIELDKKKETLEDYLYGNAREGSNYEIVKMTEISENTYEVDYKFYMGENEGIPGKMTVIFEKNNEKYIIKDCLRKTLEDVMYLEVSIEDELSGQAMYKEPVKIENINIIKELETIINSGIKHDFNGTFGLDMPPYANFYLGNGDKVTVSAVDNFEMQGEESGNYILVTINDDSNNKKTYKVNEKVGEYFKNLYDERLLTD